MADQVLIGGIRFHGHHGLTNAEREIGVRFSVDVELRGDLSTPARTDRIRDTVDYRRVHDIVVRRGRGKPHRLIETLAEGICGELLEEFTVDEVTVTVRKETPLLDGIVDYVGVSLTRRRGT